MKNSVKKILSVMLVFALIVSMIPSVFAASGSLGKATAEEIDYTEIDRLWADITRQETKLLASESAQSLTADASVTARVSQSIEQTVRDSASYVDGSLDRRGDSFTWKTSYGVSCHYSPRLRQQMRENANSSYKASQDEEIETVSYATNGGTPNSKDVYLIEPYIGIDTSFTTQYQTEAKSIASKLGGTYTLYKTTNATITNIASALSKGAVVIFDSHGNTDYARGEDYTTGATTSYLCLQSGTGITTADYNNNHALYAGANGSMKIYEVDGTAIANHISGTCPNNLLWMAICLGMATDGLQAPLRAKGVEVVYGYSQSVSFTGDYKYEGYFYDKMTSGSTVAQAISYMKSSSANWDPAYARYSLSQAKSNRVAFPIVVSSEDTYPGHGKVDAVQTVKSTYKLIGSTSTTPATPKITAVSNNTSYGTVSVSGNVITATAKTGYQFASAKVTSGTATLSTSGNKITVNATTDCTVTVTFEAIPTTTKKVTVTFSCPAGVSQSSMSCDKGGTITLPTPTGKPSDTSKTYTFAGWSTSSVSATTTAPTLYTAGTKVIVNGNATLYAVYSYTTTSSTGSTSTSYKLVTSASQLTSGSEVIIAAADYSYAMATQNSSSRTRAAVTKNSDGTLTPSSSVVVFTLGSGKSSGTYSFYDSNKGGYLYAASSFSNSLKTQSSLSSNSSWKISVTSAGVASIVAQGSASRNILRYNKTSGIFSCYRFGQYDVALYVKSTSGSSSSTTTYYTSVISGSSSGSGSSASGKTFTRVTSASALTSGSYVLVVKAGGKNHGTGTYFAIKRAADGSSYVASAAADSFMGTSSAPSSITVSDDSIVWTLTGTSSSFTLKDSSKILRASSNNLYYTTGTATAWKATYTSATGTFKIANGTRYLGLRDDLALSSTTKAPRFRCSTSSSTTSYQFYLYKAN